MDVLQLSENVRDEIESKDLGVFTGSGFSFIDSTRDIGFNWGKSFNENSVASIVNNRIKDTPFEADIKFRENRFDVYFKERK